MIPSPVWFKERTPSGLTQTTTMTFRAVVSNPTNPLSLCQITDTLTAAGRVTTRAFDMATKTLTTTTPKDVSFARRTMLQDGSCPCDR